MGLTLTAEARRRSRSRSRSRSSRGRGRSRSSSSSSRRQAGSGGENEEEERRYSHSRIILKMASKSSLEEPEGNAITHFLLTYQHTSTKQFKFSTAPAQFCIKPQVLWKDQRESASELVEVAARAWPCGAENFAWSCGAEGWKKWRRGKERNVGIYSGKSLII